MSTFESLLVLRARRDGEFEAAAAPDKGERLYGGQFLAQALMAAAATVDTGRAAHSLHVYFLRPGDSDAPVSLQVEAVRDGRAFSSRQVSARQGDRERFRMLASFQVPARTPVYGGAPRPAAPAPDSVTTTYDDFTLAMLERADWHGSDRPMDIRYVNPPMTRGEPVTEPQLTWLRIRERLRDEPVLHQAGIAYLADSTLVDHVMLPHGLRWQDADFDGASLDHAMWFHAPARADAWLLYEQSVEATGGGRGLARGRFFDEAGTLVATCMQEGLMRWHATG